jgi:uncharacterized protein YodC (DUF2158 family)
MFIKIIPTEKPLELGDVVQLKSGGPTMTIEFIEWRSNGNDGKGKNALCVWVDDNA